MTNTINAPQGPCHLLPYLLYGQYLMIYKHLPASSFLLFILVFMPECETIILGNFTFKIWTNQISEHIPVGH